MTYAERIERQKERAAARAQRRRDWAEGRREKADAAFGTAQRIADGIPMGQPILVGHHSERHHRRDVARIDGAMRRGVESTRMADYHEERADAAERRIEHMEAPGTTLRRLDKLRAELRAMERNLLSAGNPAAAARAWAPRLDAHREAIAYWEAHMARLQAEGVKLYGPADFTRGEVIETARGRYQVVRVNPKSLTLRNLNAPPSIPESMRTGTVPYDRLAGLKRRAEA